MYSFILLMCSIYIAPSNSKLIVHYMLRSQAIQASAKLQRTLGLMFKLNKHVDLIAAKFAAAFLDGTQQHSRNHFPL